MERKSVRECTRIGERQRNLIQLILKYFYNDHFLKMGNEEEKERTVKVCDEFLFV